MTPYLAIGAIIIGASLLIGLAAGRFCRGSAVHTPETDAEQARAIRGQK